MEQYVVIFTELFIGFIALFILTKVLGKTHLSQLTPFDFISALILGELLGNAIYDQDVKMKQILFATAVWGGMIYGVNILTQKFKGLRKTLEGEPSIVIQKGKLKYKAMQKSKVDINQIQSLIRKKGYFSFQEVEFAILESDGSISVLPKSQQDTPTRSDLNLPPKDIDMPVTLILDGEIVHDNLKEAGVDEQWLKNQLAMQQIRSVKEVLFAEYMKNQPLYVNRYS